MKTMAYTPISRVTATATSAAIPADQLIAMSAILTTAGSTPQGSMVIQASNDIITDGTSTPQNWAQIATVSFTDVGSVIIPKTELCYEWVRVILTLSSGTMTAGTVRLKAISL